ncbi:DUF3299 domain-containing protein [Aeoliella sp. SH292]|uniref:DUF3299 domain-containing protein n=1 Tax=Aeoliella sp. SH292 TaxID=3454464 RepID=UPI003F9C4108
MTKRIDQHGSAWAAARASGLLLVAGFALVAALGCKPEETTTFKLPADEVMAETVEDSKETATSESTPTAPPTPQAELEKPEVEPATSTPEAPAAEAPQDRVVAKTFDDIKFDIQPDAPFFREMLTPEIEQLAGQRIRIRGWMLPTFQRKGITQFVLVRDNLECCFGPGAALYDCIMVEMVPGTSADFSTRSIAVEGTFSIRPFMGPGDRHLAIYHLDGESVK